MFIQLSHRTFAVGAAALLVVASFAPAFGEGPEQFTALKQDLLFIATNLTVRRVTGVDDGSGVAYTVTASGRPIIINGLGLAVHPSRAAAEQAVNRFNRNSQIGSRTDLSEFDNVGDARRIWSYTPDGGSLIFLRENVSVAFSWAASTREAAAALARDIDQRIQSDRNVAPRGVFTEAPRIAAAGIPDRVSKSAKIAIAPEFVGMGNRADLRVWLDDPRGRVRLDAQHNGKSPTQIIVKGGGAYGVFDSVRNRTPQEDGRFILLTPAETGRYEVTLVAATPDNVVVSTRVNVEVTP